jgi:hypothetical protein
MNFPAVSHTHQYGINVWCFRDCFCLCHQGLTWWMSESHCDRQSVGQSILVSSHIWGSWPHINYCLTVTVLLISCTPSDERSGLSFVLVTWTASVHFSKFAAGPHQLHYDEWPRLICMYTNARGDLRAVFIVQANGEASQVVTHPITS